MTYLAPLLFWLGLLAPAEASSSAQALYDEALQKASQENRHLLVVLGGEHCGWCRIFEGFLDQEEVKDLLKDRLHTVHLDIASPDWQALFYRLGHMKREGVPMWWLVAPDGTPVAESSIMGMNTGYPLKPEGHEKFVSSLRAALRLSVEEAQALNQQLTSYNQEYQDKRLKRRERSILPVMSEVKAPVTVTKREEIPDRGYREQIVSEYRRGKRLIMEKTERSSKESPQVNEITYEIYNPEVKGDIIFERVLNEEGKTDRFFSQQSSDIQLVAYDFSQQGYGRWLVMEKRLWSNGELILYAAFLERDNQVEPQTIHDFLKYRDKAVPEVTLSNKR